MMMLTWLCGIPTAIPIRVWLAPVCWRSSRKSTPMSRFLNADRTLSCSQNRVGIRS